MSTFLKQEFENAGFNCEEIIENVLIVADFLKQD